MYTVDATGDGLLVRLGGLVQEEEIAQMAAELERCAQAMGGEFELLMDVRSLHPLGEQAVIRLQGCQSELSRRGMGRSAVVLDDTFAMMYFAQLAQDCGVAELQRYFNASRQHDWRARARDWLRERIDPELEPAPPEGRHGIALLRLEQSS